MLKNISLSKTGITKILKPNPNNRDLFSENIKQNHLMFFSAIGSKRTLNSVF
jgi:hypothetical protein